MTWRHYLLLAVLGLAVATLVAAFQPAPGYMDADYYYAGGLQLTDGHGFTEPYLWNYLDDPAGLPHPSNAYWMPLASLLAAAGAVLFGSGSWFAARIGFLAVAAAIPPLTAALAWSFTPRRGPALTSGLLAVFSAFYLPFLPVTDTFGLYVVFGGLFFLIVNRQLSIVNFLLLGVLAGLMHLTRADGLLWLLVAFIAVILVRDSRKPLLSILYSLLSVFAGYLLVMGPWFSRNVSTFGAPLAPGGSKIFWLTSYDQLFSYPASRLTFASWWQSGLLAILKARVWSLGLNLANTLSVQGEVFLLPLIGISLWRFRKDRRVQLAGLAWLLTLGAMTIAFPFAGARGGFFHSGAALQPVWWALAPLGLERVIEWGKQKRNWNVAQAGKVFRSALVGLAIILTAVIVWGRVMGGKGGQAWGQENAAYSQINEYLVSQGVAAEDVVMVANPPGFYLASGNPAIAIPDGDVDTLLTVARRYNVLYLILEDGSVPAGLLPVYENPMGQTDLIYLGKVENARIFLVRHL
jgi:hypothetical protein